MQQVSWFEGSSKPNEPTVIAQIFFRTNDTKLDSVDRNIINKLASHARAEMRVRGKADFLIVGRADHRGKVGYNRRLGSARAGAIARGLNLELSGEPHFNAFVGLSHGETYSRQGATDALELALDRRVDVWSCRDAHRLEKVFGDANVHMSECGERKIEVTRKKLFQDFKRFDNFQVQQWVLQCRDELRLETEKVFLKEIEKEKAALTQRAKVWPHGGVIFHLGAPAHTLDDLKLEHEVDDETVGGTAAVHWVYHVECTYRVTLGFRFYR